MIYKTVPCQFKSLWPDLVNYKWNEEKPTHFLNKYSYQSFWDGKLVKWISKNTMNPVGPKFGFISGWKRNKKIRKRRRQPLNIPPLMAFFSTFSLYFLTNIPKSPKPPPEKCDVIKNVTFYGTKSPLIQRLTLNYLHASLDPMKN